MNAEQDLTRGRAIEAALTAAAGLAIGGLVIAELPDTADSRPSAKQDATILNFALLLEDVQVGFYAAAQRHIKLSGELLRYTQVVLAHEQAHARFLRSALGSAARKSPRLDFGQDTSDAGRFALAAEKLEDLGVAAYNSQAPNLTPATLAAAGKIVSVEARHAAWIRGIRGDEPAPFATEPTTTAQRVAATLKGSGYVQ